MNVHLPSLRRLEEIEINHPNVRLLLFGSVIRQEGPLADVDLLAVYKTQEAIIQLKRDIEALTDQLQLHVIYMSEEEEAQFDFINEQRALSIDGVLLQLA